MIVVVLPVVQEINKVLKKKKMIWKQQLIYLRTNNLLTTYDLLVKCLLIIWPKQILDHVRLLSWKHGSLFHLWTSLRDHNRIIRSWGMVTYNYETFV